jgi:hypothetical protein
MVASQQLNKLARPVSHQGDKIGRFFTNWAIFKSGWRFFKEKNSPKNGDFLGEF